MLDGLQRLNEMQYHEYADPEIVARIAQYEMAFRMQTSVPELADISQEPKEVLDLYGPAVHESGTFALRTQVTAGEERQSRRPAVSQHLPALKHAGIVESRAAINSRLEERSRCRR